MAEVRLERPVLLQHRKSCLIFKKLQLSLFLLDRVKHLLLEYVEDGRNAL
jgi:hypothetical protein